MNDRVRAALTCATEISFRMPTEQMSSSRAMASEYGLTSVDSRIVFSTPAGATWSPLPLGIEDSLTCTTYKRFLMSSGSSCRLQARCV